MNILTAINKEKEKQKKKDADPRITLRVISRLNIIKQLQLFSLTFLS